MCTQLVQNLVVTQFFFLLFSFIDSCFYCASVSYDALEKFRDRGLKKLVLLLALSFKNSVGALHTSHMHRNSMFSVG